MIQDYSLATGLEFVELNWTRPSFLPERYQLKYMCTMRGTSENEIVNDTYIFAKTKSLCSVATSARMSDLLPSYICTVILLAVYNPASIDSGIEIKGVTLYKHTSKKNSDLSNFILTLGYCLKCMCTILYPSHSQHGQTINFTKGNQALLKWSKTRDWRQILINFRLIT